jgi:hypothetical protein
MYSSTNLGLLPAAWMRVGWEIRVGMDSASVSRRNLPTSEYNKILNVRFTKNVAETLFR